MTAIEAQTGNGLSLLLSCPTGARSARCPQKKNRLHDGLYRQADILHGAGFAVLQYVMRQGFPDYCKNLRYNCHNDEILVETEYASDFSSAFAIICLLLLVFISTYILAEMLRRLLRVFQTRNMEQMRKWMDELPMILDMVAAENSDDVYLDDLPSQTDALENCIET